MSFSFARRVLAVALTAMAAAAITSIANPVGAVTIEQTISREDPRFVAVSSKVVVGRNGLIYISHSDDPGYILRMKPDGSDLHGYPMVHAEQVWAVNSEGIQMSGLAHFSHTAATYDLNRNQLGTFTDFNNDNYDSPQCVCVGASGDFYALNARVFSVVRLNAQCKATKAYSLPPLPNGRFWSNVDVCESKQAFLLSGYAVPTTVMRFDGTPPQQIPEPSGFYTMDDDGIIYFVSNDGRTLTEEDLTGKVLKTIKLDVGDRTTETYPLVNVQLLGSSILVKRAHPYELFARYDLTTGAYLGSINTHHEELSATYPDAIWTAGKAEPLKIALEGVNRSVMPNWLVRVAPLGTGLWRDLPVTDGQVTVPPTAGGLYQLRVTAGTGSSEYLLNDIIEVHQPGSKGTITTMSPQSRIYYARGAEIDTHIYTRCAPSNMPKSVTLSLIGENGPVSSVTLPGAAATTYTIPGSFTQWVDPGLYRLTADAPGFTSSPQYLIIGPGEEAASPFKLMYYGDYGSPVPAGDVYQAPDLLADSLTSTGKFDINFYVARMSFYFPMAWDNSATAAVLLSSLKDRLTAEPDGVAPEKADLLFPTGEAIAAYSAKGDGIMSELINMDGGLPIGTGYDTRTHEQFASAITSITKTFQPFSAYKGWDWAANWWDNPALAFKTPADKAAYDAAIAKMKATGAWDPVLEQTGNTIIGWQNDAQAEWAADMAAIDPKLKTASSGPYRRPYVYPPTSFSNVDQVDLHYQAEQITTPLWTAHAGAYMKRPGKPAWIHPENYNDDGTGGQVLTAEWDALLGGVDGAGLSGTIPGWGYQVPDWRIAYSGLPTIYRSMFSSLHDYGPWLMKLGHESPIAIPVSRRQVKVDGWSGGIGGLYFTREFEAYMALLYAHRPADFVFIEDMTPDTLKRYKAVLLVDQTIDIDPELKTALDQAKAAGIPVYADETCRKELVTEYRSLGMGFNHLENFGAFNQDPAFLNYPKALVDDSKLLVKLLPNVQPIVDCDQPEVLPSLKTGGDGKFVLLINNTHSSLPAQLLYRVNLAASTLMPVRTTVGLPAAGKAVYDITAMRRLSPDAAGHYDADMRTSVARLYAILPSAINGIALRTPHAVRGGQSLSFAAAFLGAGGRTIAAVLPLRVQIDRVDGTSLLDEYTTTAADGRLSGTLPVALNETPGKLIVTATDLVSGLVSTADVTITPAPAVDAFHYAGMESGELRSATVGTTQTRTILPIADRFGVHLRDMVLVGDLAVGSAMQWGDNVYAVNTETGRLAWQKRVGQYWAMQPRPAGDGVSVVGFDFQSAAGFHIYHLDANGSASRRFADYGLPQELPSVFNASMSPNEPTLSFASAPNGSWFASSGNLGVAVWKADGTMLWSLDRKGSSAATAPLWISDLGNGALLVADGLKVTAYDALGGKAIWSKELAQDGVMRGVINRAGTNFILTTAFGGTVYCIKEGQIADTLAVSGDEFDVSTDGAVIVTADRNSLHVYRRGQGLLWAANSAFFWHNPRISADGRIAASDEGGDLSLFDDKGALLSRHDLGAVSAPAFMASGDLIAATWNGEFVKFDRKGDLVWRTRVQPGADDIRPTLLAADSTPTSRMTGWTNSAADQSAQLAVLGGKTTVSFQRDTGSNVAPVAGTNPANLLDGSMSAPESGYLDSQTISPFQWGSTTTAIVLDRGNERVKLTGIKFVEDETDPASWLRDVQLQYWDGQNRKWVAGDRLLSDSAVHEHVLSTPIVSNKFRILMPAYSYSSVKLKGIVLEGQSLGPNYPPDVLAGKPVAVLFDDNVEDLSDAYANGFDPGYIPMSGPEAFSGGRYFEFDPAKNNGLNLMRPIQDVTNWLYPISADPQPGQYRYLQLAIKRLSPDLKHVDIYLGHPDNHPYFTIDIKPTDDWTVYWFDVGGWLASQSLSPTTVSQMFIKCDNGAAAFDWMLLGRTMADLQKAKPNK